MKTIQLNLNPAKTSAYYIISLLFVVLFQSTSNAADPQKGFAFDADEQVIFDNFGNCVRTTSPSQTDINDKCGAKPSSSVDQTSNLPTDNVTENVNAVVEEKTPEKQTANYQPFSAVVNFNFDKHVITNSAKNVLDNFIQKAKDVTFKMINILGHADALGANEYNVRLSVNRAESVENYLTNNGIPKNKINSAGLGESEPIADNTTREGRAENRRVLIELE